MYVEAVKEWEKVQKMHEGNPLVHVGIGKAFYKQGQYKKAMEHYKIANDREGYSTAFNEYRQEMIRKCFALIILAAVILIIAINRLVNLLKDFQRKNLKYNMEVKQCIGLGYYWELFSIQLKLLKN